MIKLSKHYEFQDYTEKIHSSDKDMTVIPIRLGREGKKMSWQIVGKKEELTL